MKNTSSMMKPKVLMSWKNRSLDNRAKNSYNEMKKINNYVIEKIKLRRRGGVAN